MTSYEKFAEYYDLIYKDIANCEKETDSLERLFSQFCLRRPQEILDVGCGTGSHALILSKRGYTVTGIDISEPMIKLAKRKAKLEKTEAEFSVQDMRNIRLDKTFDCAICMFGGFGYLQSFEDLTRLFSGLGKHLRQDGLFLYEFWNLGGVKPTPFQSWLNIHDANINLYRISESNLDPKTNVLRIDMHFIIIHENKPAETFSETHNMRCYTLPEMEHYISSNGFRLVSAHDWNTENETGLKAPARETFRILAVTKKS